MNWKRQLLLAVLLFGLGMFAYWAEYKRKPQKEAETEQAKKVFKLKATSVESVKIANGHKSVELKCLDLAAKQCQPGDNSKWEITAPIKMRADDPNANGLVSALSNLDATETIDLKEETPEKRAALLKEYGLDSAARADAGTKRIEVKAGGAQTALYLGQTHPIGEGIFAIAASSGQVDETKVFIVPGYFKSNLEHELTYWRDKKLVTIASHEIASFSLKGPRVDLTGARTNGAWRLKVVSGKEKGEELPGDTENIDNLLNGATYLVAKEFAADKKDDAKGRATLASAKPLLALTMAKEKPEASPSPKPEEAKGPETVTLQLYQKNAPVQPGGDSKKPHKVLPRVFATVSNLDPVFELEPYSRDRLDKELKDLRLAKLISAMERFQIKKVEFSGPTGPLALANVDNKWLDAADQSELDQDKAQALLDKLSGTKVKEFAALKAAPKAPADALKMTIVGDEKTPLRREFLFWKAPAGLYAEDLHSSRKEALLMEAGLAEALPWAQGFFKKSAPAPAGAPAASPGPAASGGKK